MRPLRRTPMVTVEDFLATRFDGDTRYELVDGEIVAQAHPSPVHSGLQAACGEFLRAALREKSKRDGSRCGAFTEAGIRPQFDPTHNYRVADVAVTCEPMGPHIAYITAPVLLIEILSPHEEAAQRAKLHVYAAMPSVREILFLDSQAVRAELHRRDADNRWPEAPAILEGGDPLILESAGLEMPLDELYRGLGF